MQRSYQNPGVSFKFLFESKIWMQALSSTEAFSSFLEQELSDSESTTSIAAKSFQAAFSSIYYDCSSEWNKATSWANVSSRINDADFCAKQAITLR